MQKEMIVSSNGHETMVAILEDDLVAEIFVERERHRGVVGNVYKGRVSKVLPGMQSSFIDIGLERDGFLYVADVIDPLVEFDKLAGDEANGFTGGVIIRTAAGGRPKEDILGDLEAFHKIWTEMRQRNESSRAPAVLFQEQSIVARLLRDLLTEDFQAIRIDNAQEYQRVLELIERIMPSLAPKVKLYSKPYPIFDEYGVQAEIDKALKSKVYLKSGGSIVINQTEALVAIDVNTGRLDGKKTSGRLEDTIVKTNLEAVKEIVRQIRLRDLGGIIVLDLIDMEEKKNRQKVLQAVELELKKDRSPSKALQVSDFGLIIITRKRVKQSLERVLTEPCPYCSGTGVIKSSSTICYEILSEVRKVGPDLNGHRLLLRVNPDIARALKEEEHGVLKDLRQSIGKEVTIKADAHRHHEQFDVMAV